ncbi:hypothetical protein FOC1_g10009053 [Fusarium oxysporum f. sp. cubense race 1]|uniref:Uncharacterized protein n=1 Tax=Fusarium oxysporum f. sp. cubense (strain race 1) TaxID=1229664 RepID=N4TV88_FUSC1|nr:hypothetical protein FOC1_g10009053 [Fusarium oxysporum f. sp. cubense race 1]
MSGQFRKNSLGPLSASDIESDQSLPVPATPCFTLLYVNIVLAVLQWCLSFLDLDDKDQFQEYLSRILFNIVVILAPAGLGRLYITTLIISILRFS